RDPAEGLDELLHIGHATLEQITGALTSGQKLHGMLDVHVRREHHDSGAGILGSDDAGSVEPFGGVAWWHANVDEHEVGAAFARELDQLGAIAGLTHHLEALPG